MIQRIPLFFLIESERRRRWSGWMDADDAANFEWKRVKNFIVHPSKKGKTEEGE